MQCCRSAVHIVICSRINVIFSAPVIIIVSRILHHIGNKFVIIITRILNNFILFQIIIVLARTIGICTAILLITANPVTFFQLTVFHIGTAITPAAIAFISFYFYFIVHIINIQIGIHISSQFGFALRFRFYVFKIPFLPSTQTFDCILKLLVGIPFLFFKSIGQLLKCRNQFHYGKPHSSSYCYDFFYVIGDFHNIAHHFLEIFHKDGYFVAWVGNACGSTSNYDIWVWYLRNKCSHISSKFLECFREIIKHTVYLITLLSNPIITLSSCKIIFYSQPSILDHLCGVSKKFH